ncbi:MAG: alpha/beta fold hydrolase [Alphaproteobacteria bacterium]
MSQGYSEYRFRAQDGLSLYYRAYGDALAEATPVVCLPGLSRNSKDFHTVALRLAARRRVICPDFRGRGRSDYDPNWQNYQPTTYVGDMRHLLVAAGIPGAALIGTSLGGFVALGLNAMAPGLVAGILLNDVGPDVNRGGLKRIADYLSNDVPLPSIDAAAALLKQRLPDLSFTTEREWLDFADATYRKTDDGTYRFNWDVNLAKGLQQGKVEIPDLWPLYRAAALRPLLILRGAKSDVLSAATFERMANEVPAAMAVTVPGVGHAPHLSEAPVAAAIDAWLGAVDAAHHD